MWKHQNNFRNLFKVSNKDTRMTGAFVNCERISHIVVIIANFEQANNRCVLSLSQGIYHGKVGFNFFRVIFRCLKTSYRGNMEVHSFFDASEIGVKKK